MVPPQRPKILPPARSEPSGKAAWRSLLEGSADARRMAVSSDPDLDFDRLGAAADLKIGLRVPVAQCNSTPAGSAGPLLIHIVAFATPYAAQTQACWLQWVSHVLSHDTTPQWHYRLHLRTYDANSSTTNSTVSRLSRRARRATRNAAAGTFQTATWYAALRAKIGVIRDLLVEQKKEAVRSFYIVTDMDVAPLRPYSELIPCLNQDITFMRRARSSELGATRLAPSATHSIQPHRPILRREPFGHRGRNGVHVINGGFYAVRNTVSVRRFFGTLIWRLKQYPHEHDQDVANELLVRGFAHPRAAELGLLGIPSATSGYGLLSTSRAHPQRPMLDWAVFPLQLVTGYLERVSQHTVAYHSIFATNATQKATRLSAAVQRSGSALPRCSESKPEGYYDLKGL